MSEDADRFVADLARALPDALIALDVDGTLAPIVARPEDAVAAQGASEALRSLVRSGAQVALLTGRPAEAAVGIVGLRDDDSVTVLGHYGLQRWESGRVSSPPVASGVALVRRELPTLLRDAPQGVHVEDKEHALAVHTRRTDDPAGVVAGLEPGLRELAERADLELVPGRAVMELRPRGVDKGTALAELARRSRARFIVYVGDDVADLAAYRTLRELAAADRRVLAVASIDPTLSDTDRSVVEEADLVIEGPDAVVRFLGRLSRGVTPPGGGGSD